jgi:hypothetical protein
VKTVLDRKVTPMLPEPTLPKPAAARARTQPGVMTPLFSVPGGNEPDAPPSPGRRVRAKRTNPRITNSTAAIGKSSSHIETGDLLAVTAERLRRALARSFLRYGIPGDPEAAVHAAMNVIDPVLEARDTEILRLRHLMAGRVVAR